MVALLVPSCLANRGRILLFLGPIFLLLLYDYISEWNYVSSVMAGYKSSTNDGNKKSGTRATSALTISESTSSWVPISSNSSKNVSYPSVESGLPNGTSSSETSSESESPTSGPAAGPVSSQTSGPISGPTSGIGLKRKSEMPEPATLAQSKNQSQVSSNLSVTENLPTTVPTTVATTVPPKTLPPTATPATLPPTPVPSTTLPATTLPATATPTTTTTITTTTTTTATTTPVTASTWRVLADNELPVYFNSHERNGLEKRSCGHFANMTDPYRWMGTIFKNIEVVSPDMLNYNSGPCCPNGHTYGWFGSPLNETTPLRMVEVTPNGHSIPPFQIVQLLQALREKHKITTTTTPTTTTTTTKTETAIRHTANATSITTEHKRRRKLRTKHSHNNDTLPHKHKHIIWTLGDSTANQLFFGILCALARIGARVDECALTHAGHYKHPLCNMTGTSYQDSLDHSTAANVSHSVARFTYNYHDHDRNTDAEAQVELHHFVDEKFCHMLPERFADVCSAHDDRALNLMRSLDPPDIFLINLGLHKQVNSLADGIRKMIELLRHDFGNALIWRETTVTHFPDSKHTGTYEEMNRDLNQDKNKTFYTCGDVTMDPETAQFRLRVARETIETIRHSHNNTNNNSANSSTTTTTTSTLPLPILRMQDAEAHLWQTYPIAKTPWKRHPDCVHHIYTPLYFDSMFWRLSKLVQEMTT